MNTDSLLLTLIAILLPPVAVFLHRGLGRDLLINLLACLLFFVPGILHALWVVHRKHP
ncbi:YqaE/Pmp3 family membrane protein [Ferrimonas kyonanensis]|uniref:YqaE/Pmp3 family membrane protein n=1 Tax=Ferrimonas kyonanensis TaxID=364763 RepID=UPI0004016845|nr:YqaE/Pmp3 family membrane protein [Ferrimonas kyonanensis]